jgi:hypothetical protein
MARKKPVRFTAAQTAQIEAASYDYPSEAELKAEQARLNDGQHCAYGGYHDTPRDRDIWNDFCANRSAKYHH